MSLFAESSWEVDEVADRLSKQLFHKKKKGKKAGKKNRLHSGSTALLPNGKPHRNIQTNDTVKMSDKRAKQKSKKRSLSNSVRNEGSGLSSSTNVKSCTNIHSTEKRTASGKREKLQTKKRKRSLSNSIVPQESPPKRAKVKPNQDMNSRNSGSSKITKTKKDLKNRSKQGSDVSSEILFLSKKDKTVINEKVNENAEGKRRKSVESVSMTRQQSVDQLTKSQRKRKKKKLKKIAQALKVNGSELESNTSQKYGDKSATRSLNVQRLKNMLALKEKKVSGKSKVQKEPESLRDRMMSQLRASRFRFLNETLYNNESSESKKYFKEDPEAFSAYHLGYRQQIEQWPLNPLDVIISSIKKMSKDYIVADFGCGEARLAESVTQKVHSFDLVAVNNKVKACDMAHTPLLTNGVNVVIFCLSLMGTNLADYLLEANRVLKTDGIMKIADVESRFENIDEFISLLESYGFVNTWKDLSHNLFYFMDFKKMKEVNRKTKNLPKITLKPCLYKKR